jgi:hypothetical protein
MGLVNGKLERMNRSEKFRKERCMMSTLSCSQEKSQLWHVIANKGKKQTFIIASDIGLKKRPL